MPAKIVWNDELDAALLKLYRRGVRRDDIAFEMGISWPSCRKRLRELAEPTRPLVIPREPLPHTRQAVQLYREGHYPREIARLTGMSRSAVYGAVWRSKKRAARA